MLLLKMYGRDYAHWCSLMRRLYFGFAAGWGLWVGWYGAWSVAVL